MTTRPRLLDLFCGAGGASMGYHRAGFEVVGVDIAPQPRYPFEFHQADALAFPLDGFDVIHASPPCQRYSNMSKRNGTAESHPDLIPLVRRRLIETEYPYVIENVPGAPLIDPIQLCGSSFGLGVRRHRLFESNLPIAGTECNHKSQPKKYHIYQRGKWYLSPVAHVFGSGGGKAREHWPEAMGIDWMNDREIVESIPPAYTEHIGRQLYERITSGTRTAS